MNQQQQFKIYTEAQYWKREETALEKHDFVGGKIYQRPQGSFNHTSICGNLLVATHSPRSGKDYHVFNSDMKVKIEATGDSFYPDASIYCPPARFTGEGHHTLLTPTVLFEVTMHATKDFDRIIKMLSYQQIETLTDYVLVDSERVCVTHFSRDNPNEDWRYQLYSERGEVVKFPKLQLEIRLDEIYGELEVVENWVETQMVRANEE